MAKEVAHAKIAKISQAQQNMILAVLGASVVLGVAICLNKHFIEQIAYNSNVIAEEEKSIASYSDVIKKVGVCPSPKGSIYSNDELKKCNPATVDTSEVPGSLRYDILENIAANDALSSVPHLDNTSCINPSTSKGYTFKELNDAYNRADSAYDRQVAFRKIKTCSALRVVPDALPAFKNQEALLASINQIFNITGWMPESLSPSDGSTGSNQSIPAGVNPIDVSLSVDADTATVMKFLRNTELSIREFNINSANIEWKGTSTLDFRAQASAYYVDEAELIESEKTVTKGGK